MKKLKSYGVIFSLFVGVSVLAVFALAKEAPVSYSQVYFSGKLTTPEGETVADGNYHLRFSIYDTGTSISPLWEEAFTSQDRVPVVNGQFQIVLGEKTPLTFNFDEKKYWLGIQVGGSKEGPSWDEEMEPRLLITTLRELLSAGKVELSPEEFIETLVQEFESQATSTEGLTQDAFSKFLQEKLSQATSTAVIISPQTFNLLLEKITTFQESQGEEGKELESAGGLQKSIFSKMADFFSRVLEGISRKLSQIFNQLSQVLAAIEQSFAKLTKIQEGIDQILSLLQKGRGVSQPEGGSASQKPLYDVEALSQDFGQAVIKKGERSVRIFSPLVSSSAKIFVSPAGPIKGFWWISEKREGESFTVSLAVPPEQDLLLDYWIVAEGSEGSGGSPPETFSEIPGEEPLEESSSSEPATAPEGKQEATENFVFIPAGATTTEVLSPLIKEESSIVLEFTPPLVQDWDILEIVEGKSFTFTIKNPAPEKIKVKWKIVNLEISGEEKSGGLEEPVKPEQVKQEPGGSEETPNEESTPEPVKPESGQEEGSSTQETAEGTSSAEEISGEETLPEESLKEEPIKEEIPEIKETKEPEEVPEAGEPATE